VSAALQRALLVQALGCLPRNFVMSFCVRDPNDQNKDVVSFTPLMLAAHNGQMEMVQLLLEADADVTAKSRCAPFRFPL